MPSGENFALTSVRSSSPAAKSISIPSAVTVTCCAEVARSRHLDPLALLVEERDVLEGLDVEVRAKLAVERVEGTCG